MEAPLQCDQATFLARLSPTGTRDDLAASVCSALRCAPARPDAGQQRPDSNLMTGAATWGRPDVLVFAGLTAHDTQRIKGLYYEVRDNTIAASKAAIMGALSLYLNFINMFIMLLSLFG